MADRVALITGGAQGLGLASAQRLAQEDVRCALIDLDAGKAVAAAKELGGKHMGVGCDVTKIEQVRNAFAAAERELGPVSVVVNSAGISGTTKPCWEVSLDEFRRVLEINLMGTVNCCVAAVPGMIARKWGRIVNIASIAGKEGNPNLAAYSASKGGVIAFTKSLSKELATSGVLVNSIAPAVIETEMNKTVSPETLAYMVSKIPMARLGKPEEVAELVAFLASDKVSFSTGATYDISGGRATY
jgi:NAD(P)-dependent dehydrogenase (short-subunit alcohol dehydrogenase family)